MDGEMKEGMGKGREGGGKVYVFTRDGRRNAEKDDDQSIDHDH